MPLPPGRYRILAYREFHDLPRLMWVADEASRQWLLDCPFDDALDDYPAEYRVHTMGTDVEDAVEPWEKHALGLLAMVGTVPVAALHFDATHRASFHLT